jgi:hypothetical protein
MPGTSSTEHVVSERNAKPLSRTDPQPRDKGASATGGAPALVLLMRRLEHAWPLSIAVLLLLIIILGAFRAE